MDRRTFGAIFVAGLASFWPAGKKTIPEMLAASEPSDSSEDEYPYLYDLESLPRQKYRSGDRLIVLKAGEAFGAEGVVMNARIKILHPDDAVGQPDFSVSKSRWSEPLYTVKTKAGELLVAQSQVVTEDEFTELLREPLKQAMLSAIRV